MGPVEARGGFRLVVNRLYYDAAEPVSSGFAFDEEILLQALRNIYGKKGKEPTYIEEHLFREFCRGLDRAVEEGLGSVNPDDDFISALQHSNEVFSAFKVHRAQRDMAARLVDSNGKLKPFEQWLKDVQPIASHQCRSWFQTEYDTAVIRAHQAADWQQFERERDVLPNLKWMPSTSVNPGADHRPFWGTIRPIDDKFWKEHRPGDRWNCKCSLSSTDEPATPLPDDIPASSQPQPGLTGNPGQDAVVFSDDHPYFPSDCQHCPFNSGLRGTLSVFFTNAKKDCYHCARIDTAIGKANESNDVKEMFAKLHELSGADYIAQLRKLTELKIYKKVEKGILSAIGEDSADYGNLLAGAKKAVRHGYKVYILPNPTKVRSADYIFVRKGVYKMYDLKTITGTGSIGTRLEESIGQTNRVFLNLATTYPTNRMATEIKQYFEANNEALEVLVAVGKKMVSVERYMISERNFYKEFRKRIEQ